jgi:hypothetical protein
MQCNKTSARHLRKTCFWGIIVCSVIFVDIRYPSTDGLVRQQIRKEIVKMTREEKGIEKNEKKVKNAL